MLYSLMLTLAVVAALLLLSTLAFYLYCRRLPSEHSVERSARLDAPVDTVWEYLREYARQPEWRDGVDEVEKAGTDDEERDIWWEIHTSGEKIALATAEENPPDHLVRSIVADAAFDGEWEFSLESIDAESTRITMRETGDIDSPVLRFAARSILGLEKFVEAYLIDLVDELGGELEFEPSIDPDALADPEEADASDSSALNTIASTSSRAEADTRSKGDLQ